MQSFAQAWLVLTITGNQSSLPLSIALQTLPLLLFGTWGGSIVDRFDNRWLLVVSSSLNAVLSLTLGLLVLTDHARLDAIYVFALLTGFVTVVERPATQAFLSQIVPAHDVASAVGLNAMVFPFARLAGPALSSLVIALLGLSWCFFLNTVSFVVFVVALLRMRPDDLFERVRLSTRRGMVSDGLRYARHDEVIANTLVVMFFVGLAGFNFLAVVPMMAKYTFKLSEAGMALPLGLSAIGSLVAGAFAAGQRMPTIRLQAVVACAFGILLIGYGAAPTTLLWVIVAFPVGVAATLFQAFTSSILQQSTRPDMLGRVMALNSIAFLGTTPIGMLLVAWLSTVIGPRAPFVAGGIVVALTGAASESVNQARRRRARELVVR